MEAPGQQLGRLLPHLPDAKGEQQPGKLPALGALNSRQQLLGGALAQPLQLGHMVCIQKVQISGGFHQSGPYQIFHYGNAQSLNIHGPPAGKVGQGPQQLSGTFRTGAADVGPLFVPFHRCAAFRAHFGKFIGNRSLRAFVQVYRENFRNNLPRLAHQNRVADTDVLLGDEILVVEGGVGHGGSCQTHRLHDRLGGEHPGPAHLNHNVRHF